MGTIIAHQREINPGKIFLQGENKQLELSHLLWEEELLLLPSVSQEDNILPRQ